MLLMKVVLQCVLEKFEKKNFSLKTNGINLKILFKQKIIVRPQLDK